MKDTSKPAATPPAPAKKKAAPAAENSAPAAPAAEKSAQAAPAAEKSAPAAEKSAPAAPAAPAAEQAAQAAQAAGPKVHIVYDRAGAEHGAAAQAQLEKMGVETTKSQVSPLANYMKHEDRIYLPANLADDAAKILASLRTVRSQLVEHATSDSDTIYVWFVR